MSFNCTSHKAVYGDEVSELGGQTQVQQNQKQKKLTTRSTFSLQYGMV
uniref:Uncharacterized protein n=1 Tax=Lepeophtheirus salmonis TaxID=72036 RepID=A0A0K2UB21_LEPSM